MKMSYFEKHRFYYILDLLFDEGFSQREAYRLAVDIVNGKYYMGDVAHA